jgi:SAM-dependent methyltransferase
MTTCPICSTNRIKAVKTLPRSNVEVLRCENCTFHFALKGVGASPVRTADVFYRNIIADFERQRNIARRILPKRLKLYAELLGRPIRSVLEVGCATAAYADPFTELGVRYIGIEIEEDLARIARANTTQSILCCDFLDHQPVEEYDLVFASQVLEHIPSPGMFLEKVRTVAPGGILHVDVPNHESLILRAKQLINESEYGGIQPPFHLMSYTLEAMQWLLHQHGFVSFVLKGVRSDHYLLGQLQEHRSLIRRAAYAMIDWSGRGRIITAIAQPTSLP